MSTRLLAPRHTRLTTAHRQQRWLASLVDGFAHWAASTGPPEIVDREAELLVATDAYEAWLLHWPAGGALDLHDHGGAAGAFCVVRGVLVESRTSRRSLAPPSVEVLRPGRRRLLDPDDVHDVANHGPAIASSVHVYAPRLESMTFYEPDTSGVLAPARTEDVTDAVDVEPRFGWGWPSAS